jgi:tetratricopeptide (TPR) repeat protein
LKVYAQLAWSIAKQGKYLESENIFRTALKRRSKILGESHPNTLKTAWLLARSLEPMGHLEEATIWYEKSF